MSFLVFKDGKPLISDGGVVVSAASPPPDDCCCGGCITGSLSESFATAIPGDWFLDNQGTTLQIVSGRLQKQSGAGDNFILGPCVARSVFAGAFSIAMETQMYSDDGGLPGSALTGTSGLRFTGADGFDIYFYRKYNGNTNEAVQLAVTLAGGGGASILYDNTGAIGTVIGEGDILRLEIDGTAEEVDEIRAYFNGVLVHTETYTPAESIGDLSSIDAYLLLQLLVSTGTTSYETYEYFNITIA